MTIADKKVAVVILLKIFLNNKKSEQIMTREFTK
jgi:hypothetical protein